MPDNRRPGIPDDERTDLEANGEAGASGRDRTDASRLASGGSPEAVTRIFLRPLGSSLPLGFLGLAGATLTLAGLQLGWVPLAEQRSVAIVLVAFAVPLQVISSLFAFLARDSVVGTGMAVLSGTWLVTGVTLFTSRPGSGDRALALFLFVAAAAMLVPVAGAVANKLVPALIMAMASTRFALVGLAEWFGGTGWVHAAGWEGVALCIVALYGALGFQLEESLRRDVLPVGRWRSGAGLLRQRLPDQDDLLEREPGVRRQL